MAQVIARGHSAAVPIGSLRPNDYNPNVMGSEMFQKAIESIHEFGFVDPITVRWSNDKTWEIVDGEHRWRAATGHSDHCRLDHGFHVGYDTISVWDLGKIDDETAQQLTIVLNETRGSPEKKKLAELVASLAQKRSQLQLQRVLPFSAEQLADLTGRRAGTDFVGLQRAKQEGGERWVERIYRLPKESAEVIDEAINRVMTEDSVEQPWRALEMIAADFLASPSSMEAD